jgi:sec-independent protein translocase protein TatC
MRNILKIIWRIISAPFRFIVWVVRMIVRWIKNVINNIRIFLTEEPEDEPLPETFAKTIENPMGMLEHIDALRKHLMRAVLFLALMTGLSFIYTRRIIDILARPVGGIDALRAIDPTEPLGVFMRVALLTGFSLALPYIALELWLFAAPGLKKDARIFGLLSIPIATLFFLGGMAFAYFVMLPAAIPFLVNFMGMTAELRPSTYVSFVTGIMFWIGASFEFPLVIYVLARIGIVNSKVLSEQWRLAIVIIAVLAAAITPTIDPVNMALVMGPLILLYFLSIFLAGLAQRGKKGAQA